MLNSRSFLSLITFFAWKKFRWQSVRAGKTNGEILADMRCTGAFSHESPFVADNARNSFNHFVALRWHESNFLCKQSPPRLFVLSASRLRLTSVHQETVARPKVALELKYLKASLERRQAGKGSWLRFPADDLRVSLVYKLRLIRGFAGKQGENAVKRFALSKNNAKSFLSVASQEGRGVRFL